MQSPRPRPALRCPVQPRGGEGALPTSRSSFLHSRCPELDRAQYGHNQGGAVRDSSSRVVGCSRLKRHWRESCARQASLRLTEGSLTVCWRPELLRPCMPGHGPVSHCLALRHWLQVGSRALSSLSGTQLPAKQSWSAEQARACRRGRRCSVPF